MNVKKSFFLFLALLLPIVTFLFLKFFGKNEFAVQPLFQQELHAPSVCNGVDYSTPYVLPDSVLGTILQRNDSMVLVVFGDAVLKNKQEQLVQLTRVFKEFANDPIHVVKISVANLDSARSSKEKATNLVIDENKFSKIRNCAFLLSAANDAVVVDNKGRIMGQYIMTDREDTDRLILELKILLKKY